MKRINEKSFFGSHFFVGIDTHLKNSFPHRSVIALVKKFVMS